MQAALGRIVSLSLATCGAFVFGGGGTAQETLPTDPGAPHRERMVSEEGRSSLRFFAFEGQVLEPDGTPAEGAVVVTSAGGQAVTDADGGFELVVRASLGATVQVTAVGRGSLVASQHVTPMSSGGTLEVGTLLLGNGSTCPPEWLPTFGGAPGLSPGGFNTVRALTVYDDGNGAALYAGGSFSNAGTSTASQIAKWDGASWSELGDGVSNAVSALVVYDDGGGAALYAGGDFTFAGGAPANRIAKWNGSTWSTLGTGMDLTVNTLAVYDDGGGAALYAGGRFTTAGGVVASRIAKWDGSSWSPLGAGITGPGPEVEALAVYDDGGGAALYAGGFFSTAGGAAASAIAKWNGSSWSGLGSGPNGRVLALTVYDDGGSEALYAGGTFSTAGGGAANRIAKWDGSSWSGLGSGMNEWVHALTVHDDGGGPALYAGGRFTTAGGGAASHIAKWDGSSWSGVGGGVNDWVLSLIAHDDGSGAALFVGGDFATAGGAGVSHIAKWDGSAWSRLGGNGMNYLVNALAVYDDGGGAALYAGGDFTIAGGMPANRIAKWDGSSWSPLGSGMNYDIWALAVYDDGGGEALYAGGNFGNAGGVGASRIAKWDGSSWSALGSGMNNEVYALAVYDDGGGDALYAGGDFTTAGGLTRNRIAKWNGSSWLPLGTGLNDRVEALAVYDDGGGQALYAGGFFTNAGGFFASRIAKWNGSSWSGSSLGGGTDGWVRALTVHDDGGGAALYAGGTFETAGGVVASRIAKWNGSNWSAVGNLPGSVRALTVFDDGGGAALYAGRAGMMKWDGSNWSPLGSGVNGEVRALAVYDDGGGDALHVGGVFTIAIDSGDSYLAKWGRPMDVTPPVIVCPANSTVECTDPSGAVVLFGPTATDVCDSAPIVVSIPTSGSIFPLGTTMVTCTATDASGNFDTCSFDVTVEDTTPPDIACPQDITVECMNPAGEVVTFSPTATDLCDPSPSVVAVPPSGSTFALGTTVVTVSAMDASGNESMCTFDVVVEDTTDPLVTCPGNMMVECAGGGTQVSWSASASDACDPAPAVSCSPPSGSLFGLGTTTVTCTATDASGNSAMCSFDVIVVDTTDPSVTCPADVFMECADPGGEVVSFSASATDGCDPAPDVSCVPASGSLFPIGTTTVTCTATDASGNTDVCTFDVTLSALDTTPPSISCPANMTVQCTSPDGAVVTFTTTASDACDPSPTVECSPPSGSLFPFGTTPVSCTAMDAAGNFAMCSFSVTVQDTTPPVVHCPPNQTVPAGTQAFWSASATDSCDGALPATCSPLSGSVFPEGMTTVTCMATDSSGNTGFCTFTVTGMVNEAVPTLGPAQVALLALAVLGLGLTLRRRH